MRTGASTCANRSFLISPLGEVLARYDKIHMFDVQLNETNMYRESATFDAGAEAVIAETPLGRVGMTICYDMRFSHLYRLLAQSGAQIVTAPAAFTRITGEAHWHVLLRARAIETGCYVLAPAQGGVHQDGRETFGRSLIVGPWGEVVAEADGDAPCVIHAQLDLSRVGEARRKIPSLEHDRPFALRTSPV